MKAGSSQLQAGEPYGNMAQTVGVNFLDYTLYPKHQEMHTAFVLTSTDGRRLKFAERSVIHMIEVPKVARAKPGGRVERLSAFERWVYYLHGRGHEAVEDDPILLQILEDSPDIQAAEERYRRFLSDPVLRNQYRQRDKNLRDYNNRMGAAREEGLAAGREEGRQEGLKKVAKKVVGRRRWRLRPA